MHVYLCVLCSTVCSVAVSRIQALQKLHLVQGEICVQRPYVGALAVLVCHFQSLTYEPEK